MAPSVERGFGASQIVLPLFGVGAIVGLVTGIPVLLAGGAGAILGLVLGATVLR